MKTLSKIEMFSKNKNNKLIHPTEKSEIALISNKYLKKNKTESLDITQIIPLRIKNIYKTLRN